MTTTDGLDRPGTQPEPTQPQPTQPQPTQAQPTQAQPTQAQPIEVVHRRYVSYAEAHYAGNLVHGGYLVALFGDVATEVCIRTDGDEGLFASYSDIQFLAPVRGGDVVEVRAILVRRGRRSRQIRFEAHVTCRGAPQRGANAADVLAEPLLVATAVGTVVAPG